MKKIQNTSFALLGIAIASSTQAATINVWSDDFEAETIGVSVGTNTNIGGTLIAGRNTPTLEIVAAPAGFTNATGNVLQFTEPGTNNSAALSTNGDGGSPRKGVQYLGLSSAVSATDTFTFSADIYWETFTLARNIGELQARFADAGGSQGNGLTLTSGRLTTGTTAGQYQISYTGTVSDFFDNPTFSPTQARPFLFMDQRTGSDSVFYFDNISFTVESIPEPSSLVLLGLSGLGLMRRRR